MWRRVTKSPVAGQLQGNVDNGVTDRPLSRAMATQAAWQMQLSSTSESDCGSAAFLRESEQQKHAENKDLKPWRMRSETTKLMLVPIPQAKKARTWTTLRVRDGFAMSEQCKWTVRGMIAEVWMWILSPAWSVQGSDAQRWMRQFTASKSLRKFLQEQLKTSAELSTTLKPCRFVLPVSVPCFMRATAFPENTRRSWHCWP